MSRYDGFPLLTKGAHPFSGSQLEAAVLHLSHAFEVGQVYVALSRVTSMQGVFISKGKKTRPRAFFF